MAVNTHFGIQPAARVVIFANGTGSPGPSRANSDHGTTDTAVTATAMYRAVVMSTASTSPIGMVRFGFFTSSDTLSMSSNPTNAKNVRTAPDINSGGVSRPVAPASEPGGGGT